MLLPNNYFETIIFFLAELWTNTMLDRDKACQWPANQYLKSIPYVPLNMYYKLHYITWTVISR